MAPETVGFAAITAVKPTSDRMTVEKSSNTMTASEIVDSQGSVILLRGAGSAPERRMAAPATNSNAPVTNGRRGICGPIVTPRTSPSAPGAMKIPGAAHRFGVRFRLSDPAPTWNMAFPTPATQIDDTGKTPTVSTGRAVNRHPPAAASRAEFLRSTAKPTKGWIPKARKS